MGSQEKSLMVVMNHEGDTKVIWDSTNDDEVENVRKQFKDLKKKGFKAFSVDKKGKAHKPVDEFDPDEEKLIFVPQMQGG